MRIRLILDTTALLAYLSPDMRSMQLVELIESVEDNGDQVGVPALCFQAALHECDKDAGDTLLQLVVGQAHPVTVTALGGDEVAYAALSPIADELAQAALEAIRNDCMLGTYAPALYDGVLADDLILPL